MKNIINFLAIATLLIGMISVIVIIVNIPSVDGEYINGEIYSVGKIATNESVRDAAIALAWKTGIASIIISTLFGGMAAIIDRLENIQASVRIPIVYKNAEIEGESWVIKCVEENGMWTALAAHNDKPMRKIWSNSTVFRTPIEAWAEAERVIGEQIASHKKMHQPIEPDQSPSENAQYRD